jgi:hypothetical protein
MVYTIGFGMRNSPDVVTVMERNTHEEIRFIDTD